MKHWIRNWQDGKRRRSTKMPEIWVGMFRIYIENRNGQEQAICPNCGVALDYRQLGNQMPATETGYFYCSVKCAKEHVEKEMNKTEAKEQDG